MRRTESVIRKEAASLMESFNKALADAFDAFLGSVESEENLREPDFEESMRNSTLNDLQDWFAAPQEALSGRSPGQAIDDLDSVAEAVLYFEEAAVHCDDAIPDLLKVKLGSFGSDAVDALMTLALRPSWEAGPETPVRPVALAIAGRAIELLGEWETREALELFAAKFESLSEPDEGIAEFFRTYCVAVGPEAAKVLAACVEKAAREEDSALDGPYDYMVIAIADIGRKAPDERLFQCLRTAFRKMEHKAVGAICLGDYGDGRAVSALKGFLDRFEGRVDRQTFYEVTNAIRRLGGELADVRNPFAADGERPS